MKVLFRALVVFIVALPILAIAAVLMCFQDRPLVSTTVQLTPHDIEKAKRILDQHDPRKAGRDGLQTVAIDERDLETTLNYAASRIGHGAVRVVLRPGAAWRRGPSSCRAVRSAATSTSMPRCVKPARCRASTT